MFDIFYRIYLEKGIDVRYCMNITDIDDKILDKVKLIHWNKLMDRIESIQPDSWNQGEKNLENLEKFLCEQKVIPISDDIMTPSYELYKSFVTEQEEKFWNDMKSLNILIPNFIIRVSDVIPEMIKFTENIIAKGMAYESNSSVYFDTENFIKKFGEDYDEHKLYMIDDDAKNIKSDFNKEKKNIKDFVLWKAAKKYEISFDSPWGKGRCGWSLECSVMIEKIFKNKIDIHGGGIDLKFPHHHNEFVQTLALTNDKKWANKFVHCGHLHIQGLKMSQSLKNFTTIREFLKKYNVRQIRLLFLLHQWDQSMDLNEDTIGEMIELDKRIGTFLDHLNFIMTTKLSPKSNYDENDEKFNELCKVFLNSVDNLMNTNFNIPFILKHMRQLINETYVYLESKYNFNLIEKVHRVITKTLNIFGIDYHKIKSCEQDKYNNMIGEIRSYIRNEAKKITDKNIREKIFSISDWIRDVKLKELGLGMQDEGERTKIIIKE
jgi:cysteinyl-tRNA synthetase